MWNGNSVFSGTRLRAAYAEGIKEPSFEQSFGITGTFPTLPNPNLKPEQNHAVEAGFDQSLFGDRSSLTAVYYHNSFRNQIEYQYNEIDFTSQYVNINRSFAQGAEVELRGQISSSLLLTGAYTYTSTQIPKAPPCDPLNGCDPLIYGEGAPLLRRPKHAGTLLLTLREAADGEPASASWPWAAVPTPTSSSDTSLPSTTLPDMRVSISAAGTASPITSLPTRTSTTRSTITTTKCWDIRRWRLTCGRGCGSVLAENKSGLAGVFSGNALTVIGARLVFAWCCGHVIVVVVLQPDLAQGLDVLPLSGCWRPSMWVTSAIFA